MKEAFLNLDTKTNELRFEKPEPYITIHIVTKEAYEKLADVIDREIPAKVEIEEVDDSFDKYQTYCPGCRKLLGAGLTPEDVMKYVMGKGKYCPNCGQALVCEVQE